MFVWPRIDVVVDVEQVRPPPAPAGLPLSADDGLPQRSRAQRMKGRGVEENHQGKRGGQPGTQVIQQGIYSHSPVDAQFLPNFARNKGLSWEEDTEVQTLI